MISVSPSRKASNALLRAWAKDITGHVLSIGSGTDEDKQGGHYRDYFLKATSYTTSEPEPSKHCDLVLDVMDTDVASGHYDAIFCSGVLEHVPNPWRAAWECRRILKPGGTLLLGVPLHQPLHRVPHDYWRFTGDGVRRLLETTYDPLQGRFLIEALEAIGDPAYPTTFWAKARAV